MVNKITIRITTETLKVLPHKVFLFGGVFRYALINELAYKISHRQIDLFHRI